LASAPVKSSSFFDPARGYAFLGKEGFKGAQVAYRTTIMELSEPAPGIFYPRKALVEYNYPLTRAEPPEDRHRGTFQATSIIVNDPNFDPNIFILQWPPGTAVYNQETRQVTRAP
jgi:hypothetical protein